MNDLAIRIGKTLGLVYLCAEDSTVCNIQSITLDKEQEELFITFLVTDFAMYRDNETRKIADYIDDIYFVREDGDTLQVRISIKYSSLHS